MNHFTVHVSSVKMKENKRNLEIPCTLHIHVAYLRLSD